MTRGAAAAPLEPDGEVVIPKTLVSAIAFRADGKAWLTAEGNQLGVWEGLERRRAVPFDPGLDDQIGFDATNPDHAFAGRSLVDLRDGKVLVTISGVQLPGEAPDRGWSMFYPTWTPDAAEVLARIEWRPSRCCDHREVHGPKNPERVFLYRVAGGKLAGVSSLLDGGSAVDTLAAGADWLAVAADELTIWSRADHTRRFTVARDGMSWDHLTFSLDGRTLVAGRRRHILQAFDARTEFKRTTHVRIYSDEGNDWIECLAVAPRAPLAAFGSGGGEHTIQLWSLETGKRLARLELGAHDEPHAIAFSPAGDELLVAIYRYPDTVIRRYRVR